MRHLPPDYVMAMLERRFVREASTSLHRQLYDLVRQLIIDGELSAGARLPSSRLVAERLALSRHTVYGAIEQLSGEGYLVGLQGSGTYVSHHFAQGRSGLPAPRVRSTVSDLSARGRSLTKMQRSPFQWDDPSTTSAPPPFRVGLPAIDAFPQREWAQALSRAWLSNAGHLGYQQPTGYRPLREAICAYLHASRGLRCLPEQIVITSGSQNGLDLALRLLIDPGELVVLEDPGYLGARSAAQAAGGRVEGVPVDEQGLVTAHLVQRDPKPRVVLVTPTHQFPTGVSMALDRRLAMLEWARDNRVWVIEDDYDSEFRYGDRRFDPLWVLDQGERVIYAGTFSKVMFPALRLGYLVLPEGLVDSFEAAHVSTDIHRPHLEQLAMAAFMDDGRFARHLRRTADLHTERRQELLDSAAAHLAGLLVVEAAESGLHVLAMLPAGSDDVRLCWKSAKRGIEPWPLSIHHLLDPTPGMLLGFGGSKPAAIRAGVRTLAGVLSAS